MVNIRISSNYSKMERELDRLENIPSMKAKTYLDTVLNAGFKLTQGAVHVVTGSLKASGQKSSKMEGDSWVGEISYGGISLGVNNPVTYAIYEKARDDDHDFMTPLKTLDPLWVKTILRILSK